MSETKIAKDHNGDKAKLDWDSHPEKCVLFPAALRRVAYTVPRKFFLWKVAGAVSAVLFWDSGKCRLEFGDVGHQ